MFWHGARLAGQVRFIARALSARDAQIHRNLFARAHAQTHARRKGLDRALDLLPPFENRGGLGGAAEERADFALGARTCVVLHRAGSGEEKEKQRTFAPRSDKRGAEGDREHEEMDFEFAVAEALP